MSRSSLRDLFQVILNVSRKEKNEVAGCLSVSGEALATIYVNKECKKQIIAA